MSTLNSIYNDSYFKDSDWQQNNSTIRKNISLIDEMNRSINILTGAKQSISQKFILLTKDFEAYNKDKIVQLQQLDSIRKEIIDLLNIEKNKIEFFEEQAGENQYVDINFLKTEIECSHNWLNDEHFTIDLDKNVHEANLDHSKKQKLDNKEDEEHQKAIEQLKISKEQLEGAHKHLATEKYKLEALALKIKKHRKKLLKSL